MKKKLMQVCKNCGTDNEPMKQRCASCRSYLKEHMIKIVAKRGNVMKELESGEKTLQQVADMFGLTRERIRQIYKSETGNKYTAHRELLRRKKEERRNEEKYKCVACGASVSFKNARKTLCPDCYYISSVLQRNPHIIRRCENCGEPFYPLINAKDIDRGKFCSRGCNLKRIHKNKQVISII